MATAQTYVLVDANDVVVNSCLWDGNPDTWHPPEGLRAFPYEDVWHNGWKWDGAKAYDPNPPPQEEKPLIVLTTVSTEDGMDIL